MCILHLLFCAHFVYIKYKAVIIVSSFGDRLRILRLEHGLSQGKLSEYIGVSKSSINMYERGEREPGFETIEAIADFFNVDIDYLLGRSDIPNRMFPDVLSMVTEFMADKPARVGLRIVEALSSLNDEELEIVRRFVLGIAEARKVKEDELDIEAQVAAYRAKLEAEKKAREESAASHDTKGT